MKSALFLCGAGNPEGVRLALRINEKQMKWEKIFICDDDMKKKGKQILGIEIIGPFESLRNANPETMEVVNLIARTTIKRQTAFEKIKNYGIPFVSLIDPEVDMFGVEYTNDIIIYHNVTFSAGAYIDRGSVVFTGAVVGHGCSVGKFCVIAPGAVLNARIVLEDGVYIGTNASILPDLKIGEWSTIGLNSGVVQDIPAGATAMGVPAELIFNPAAEISSKLQKQYNSETDFSFNFKMRPRYDIEKTISTIWENLLNVKEINADDNFFDLGGHSLQAVQLFEQLKQKVDNKLTLIDIFHYPTINSFINFLEDKNSIVSENIMSSDSKHAVLFRQRLARLRSKNKNNQNDLNTQELN